MKCKNCGFEDIPKNFGMGYEANTNGTFMDVIYCPNCLSRDIESIDNKPDSAPSIDEVQTKMIEELKAIDKKHDAQFLAMFIVLTLFFVWMSAITGFILWGK